PPSRVAGSRDQVLRARSVLVGGVPVRRRPRVRRHRDDLPHGHLPVPRRQHRPRRGRAAHRPRTAPRRARVQGGGGAVPHVVALVQDDVKRMLAYSSIAHAGYILIGFAAAAVSNGGASARGLQSALFYLLVYAFMTIGAFAVVTVVARSSHDARHTLSEYRGLATERPALAALLAFFLLAQAGVPFTGGFVAKLQVF